MSAEDATEKRQAIDEWFAVQGVPHFSGNYLADVRESHVVLLLIVIVAVQIGAAPWFLTPGQILVVPPVLLAIALFAPRLWLWPRLHRRWRPPSPRYAIPFILLLAAAALYLFKDSPYGWLRPEAWFDSLVLVATLYTCALLLPVHVWSPDHPGRRLRASVRVTASVATCLLLLEGAALPPLTVSVDAALSRISPALVPVPHALPGFAVAYVLLLLAVWLSGVAGEPTGPAPNTQHASTYAHLVPVLVLVVGFDTAVFSYPFSGWAATAASSVFAIFLAVTIRVLQPGAVEAIVGRARIRLEGSAPVPRLALWFLLYLLALPAWQLLATWSVDGRTELPAGLAALGVNVLYAGAALLVLGFGFHRIVAWVGQATKENGAAIGYGMARGLPFLLAFTVFFVLTQELWEVTVELDRTDYALLLALVAFVTAVALGILFAQPLRQPEFEQWDDVEEALGNGSTCSLDRSTVDWMLNAARKLDVRPSPPRRLSVLESLNALVIVAVHAAFVCLPIAGGTFVLFFVLGHVAVPSAVAAEWAFGDGTDPGRGVELASLPLLDQPWTRVALLLALFSVLYLTASVAANKEQRDEFVLAATKALRARLAMRLLYRRVFGEGEEQLVQQQADCTTNGRAAEVAAEAP